MLSVSGGNFGQVFRRCDARKHRLELVKVYAPHPVRVVDVEAEPQRLVPGVLKRRHAL